MKGFDLFAKTMYNETGKKFYSIESENESQKFRIKKRKFKNKLRTLTKLT